MKSLTIILLIDEIENNLRYIFQQLNQKKITLQAHPFIEAYLTKGFYSVQRKWFMKYKKWVNIKKSTDYQFLEYHFFDNRREEINLK